MKHGINPVFCVLCALSITGSVARAQIYEFQFVTDAPGFAGALFFDAPSGSGPFYQVLADNSFITTPDGTFTVAQSVLGGPLGFPLPPTVWSPGGITALNLGLYEVLNSQNNYQLYYWTATPTSIGDSPAAAIPLIAALDPGASGTWVYVGGIPEPGAVLLMALGVAALLVRPGRGPRSGLPIFSHAQQDWRAPVPLR